MRLSKQPIEQFTSRYSGIYQPILNDNGELQGVIFSGLLRHSSLVGLVNQSNLFILIFLLSSAGSLAVGWLVSQRLTKPCAVCPRACKLSLPGITASAWS